jgi:hypothetical protein
VSELAAGNDVAAIGNQVIASSSLVGYQTRIGMTYRPVDIWSFAYNMTWSKNEPDPGLEGTQLNHGLSASYAPVVGFSVSASISENRDEVESREDRRNRTYSLAAQKEFWETMNLSMGYSHYESYEDATRNRESDSLNGYLNAQLFPDLTASMNLHWSRSKDFQEGEKSESYGLRLDSTAQLTPRLNATAYYGFDVSKNDNEAANGASDSSHYGLTLNFRPSDILLFYAGIKRDVEQKATEFNGSASWRVTPKIQTSFNTAQDLEQGNSESYSASVTWLLSSHLSLRGSGSYFMADGEDVWSWRLNMNATF